MRAVLLAILIAFPACAQTLHGLGFSSKTCIDLDGDGYGTGPLANLMTTASGPVIAGIQTVTLGATTGLAAGQRVRYDTGSNLEFVTLTAVTGSSITGTFLGAHASGVSVSAGTKGDGSAWFPGYATDDPGCLGLDADDRDATVHTAAQGITKYGSMAALLAKLGRDWQVLEADAAADVIGTAGQAAAAAALLINPAHIYYVAPASPSSGCIGTAAQCTGLPANNCTSINSPCLTISNLISAGYTNTGLGGDLIIARDGWNNNSSQVTLYSGASTRYNGLWSYPGEHAVLTTAIKLGAPNSCTNPTQTNYVWVDGMRLEGTTTQFGGAIVGGSCDNTSGQNHDIVVTHNNGTESDSGGLAPLTGFDHIDNWTIAYNTFHDDNCPPAASCNTPHGIYLGSHQGPSSNTTIRRNLIYRNSWNGLHWNGVATGFFIDQNVVYDNGVSGLDFEEGLSSSYIRGNIVFNNAKQLVFYNYPGNCPTQTGYQSSSPLILCPANQNYNLIESNTFYMTGNADISNPGSNPDAGCPTGVLNCAQPPIQISNATSPLAGDLGNNTFRNNIIVAYGWNNAKPGVAFGDPTGNGTCGTTCQGWASTSTFDHNLFWQSDGLGGTSVLLMAANKYTCATAGSVTAAFTNCNVADPQFTAETIANWNIESYFDFRLLPSSPALHAATTNGIPNYDAAGRAYAENGPSSNPSLGALERNLYGPGWTTLTSAGLSPAVAPANGYPAFSNCLTPSGLDASPCPPNGYPFQTQYTSELTAWTDGIKREKPGSPKQLVWFGGGHSDYIGNEVYAISLNLATPSIARVIGPSTFTAPGLTVLQTWDVPTTNPQPALADGNPNTRHTPGNLAYNSDTDKMGLFGGGLAGGNGAHTYDTWEFNFGTVAWERYNSGTANTNDVSCSNYGTGYSTCGFAVGEQVNPIATFNGSFQGSNIYDPLTKTYWVYWGAAGGFSVITQYYPSLHQHVVRATNQPMLSGGTIGGQNTRVFISDRRWIFVTDWNNNTLRSWIIDISGVTSQTPASSPNPAMVAVTTDASCNGLLETPGPGLVYLPAQGRILGFPAGTGGNTYYLMDPATWTCTAGSFTGGPPSNPLNQYIIGKMQYFTSLDATLLVNDVGANAPRVLNLNIGDPGGSTAPGSGTSGSGTSGSGTSGSGTSGAVPSGGSPPSISITSPASGSTLSASVTISANASAPAGVASVQFKLDGASLGAALTSAAYSVSWNTTGAANGSHTLTAVVIDMAGNAATSAGVVVTVNNNVSPPPTISVTSPTSGVTLVGAIAISANASGALPIANVQFKIDGINLGTATSTSPYSLSWATTGFTNGPHTVSAVAVDAAGNAGTAPVVTVMVSNSTGPPPTQGLSGYWNFDENSGSIAHDSSGNGYNGTVTSPAWVPGKINSALSFSGSASYVVTPGIPLSKAFSISAWVNSAVATQIAYARIAETQFNGGLYLGTDASGTQYKFIANNGSGSTGSCGASFGCAQGGAVTTGWHLLTATFDGTTGILYVDNSAVASDTFTAPASATYPLYIGRYYAGNGYDWNGVIDEVRLFNRALNGGEVSAIYDYTGAPPTTQPAVSISAPAANTTVSNTVTVSATATGNTTITGVQFQLDGTNIGSAVTAVPYSVSWPTTATSNGTHSLSAIATDASGSATSASVTVTVSNSSGTATVLSCDLNGDGVVNDLDVQLATSQALGVTPCTNADLQENGQCNVIDVQRIINASLGGACRIGQ
jgi:hypothetical protein